MVLMLIRFSADQSDETKDCHIYTTRSQNKKLPVVVYNTSTYRDIVLSTGDRGVDISKYILLRIYFRHLMLSKMCVKYGHFDLISHGNSSA